MRRGEEERRGGDERRRGEEEMRGQEEMRECFYTFKDFCCLPY
jgi:hypothetical protein